MPEQKKNRKYLPLVVFSLYKPRKQRNKINILQVSGIVIKRKMLEIYLKHMVNITN